MRADSSILYPSIHTPFGFIQLLRQSSQSLLSLYRLPLFFRNSLRSPGFVRVISLSANLSAGGHFSDPSPDLSAATIYRVARGDSHALWLHRHSWHNPRRHCSTTGSPQRESGQGEFCAIGFYGLDTWNEHRFGCHRRYEGRS